MNNLRSISYQEPIDDGLRASIKSVKLRLLGLVLFWIFYATALWLDYALGNTHKIIYKCDPATTSLLVSLALSAELSILSAEVQALLAPRPKPLERGKLQGDLLLQNVGEGLFWNEVYGRIPLDYQGGVRLAGIIIWFKGISLIVEVAPASSGGQGGKGGFTPRQTEKRYRYFATFMAGIANNRGNGGQYRVRQIKANTDVLYQDFTIQTEPTGILDEDFVDPEPTFDHFLLPDPRGADTRPFDQHNRASNPDTNGVISGILSSGSPFRIYPGNKIQPVDPAYEAIIDGMYGVRSTPAHRNICYVMFENFEFTRYGSIPNFTFVVEHETIASVGAMMKARARRAGVAEEDMDFSPFNALDLRGYPITQRQAPRVEMQLLTRFHDVDVVEDADGKIKGVFPSEVPVVSIPNDELGVSENPGDEKRVPRVSTVIKNEQQVPRFMDCSFFDANNEWEIGNVHTQREITVSQRRDQIELPLTLNIGEAQRFIDRDLQKQWAEKDPVSITTFYKYAPVIPTNLIEVEEDDGTFTRMRAKAVEGGVPGALKFSGVSRNLSIVAPSVDTDEVTPVASSTTIPANTIGTLIDIVRLRSQDNTPGFYAACCARDASSGYWNSATLYWLREAGLEALDTFTAQATLGRTITGASGVLGDVPGGWSPGDWDGTNTVTVDLFHGELESLTDAEVLDGNNILIIGNECIAFGAATRDNTQPNRWALSHLQRKLKNTVSTGHLANERVVLMNSAVKFIPVDAREKNVPHTFTFATNGQDPSTTSRFDFTWTGQNIPATAPLMGQDTAVPTVTIAPTIARIDGQNLWDIYWPYPDAHGATLTNVNLQVVKVDDDSILRDIMLGVVTSTSEPMNAFDCKIKYRWRNNYRESSSDGWSAWSPAADAFGLTGSAENPPTSEMSAFDNDPNDVRVPSKIGDVELL